MKFVKQAQQQQQNALIPEGSWEVGVQVNLPPKPGSGKTDPVEVQLTTTTTVDADVALVAAHSALDTHLRFLDTFGELTVFMKKVPDPEPSADKV